MYFLKLNWDEPFGTWPVIRQWGFGGGWRLVGGRGDQSIRGTIYEGAGLGTCFRPESDTITSPGLSLMSVN